MNSYSVACLKKHSSKLTGAKMTVRNVDHLKKRKTLLAMYNMVPNVLWSVVNLTPIVVFCFTLIELHLLYVFLAISCIPVVFKKSFLNGLQIGKTTKTYRKLGVHLINRFSQNGGLINKAIKRKFPNHKILTTDKKSIAALINQTYIFEKFHLILFLFFSLITFYAVLNAYWVWAAVIVFTNVAYNIYPILLQHYIRLKLTLFNERAIRRHKSFSNR